MFSGKTRPLRYRGRRRKAKDRENKIEQERRLKEEHRDKIIMALFI